MFQAASPPLADVIEFSDEEAALEGLEIGEEEDLEDLDIDEEAGPEDLEIDELSDEEDDCRAHTFLHSSQNQATTVPVSQPLAPAVQAVAARAPPQPPSAIRGFAVSS